MLVIISVDHNLCLLRKMCHLTFKSANFIVSYSTLTGAMGTGSSVPVNTRTLLSAEWVVHKAKPAKGSAGKGSKQTSEGLTPWKPACSERKTKLKITSVSPKLNRGGRKRQECPFKEELLNLAVQSYSLKSLVLVTAKQNSPCIKILDEKHQNSGEDSEDNNPSLGHSCVI